MISPKVESSRIKYALRGCRERDLKVYEPTELVKKAVDEFGDSLAVSCSFGSCSVVVLHMALEVKPDIKVVFNNTGVEYPETYAYRELLRKEWNLNLIETKPQKTFWQCVKEYGFPLIRKTGKSKHKKHRCCIYLKEKPFKNFCKSNSVSATLTGLRASESGVRMLAIGQVGQFYLHKTSQIWKAHPIAFWNYKQVWRYLEENNIPINEVYTKLGLPRNGCMPCTGFIDWEKQLAKANLKMYRWVQKLRKVRGKDGKFYKLKLLDDFRSLEEEVYRKCGTPTPQLLEDWF